MTTKAVLVTGCSTGIGRATALALAGAGFQVFAGVRRAGDAPTHPDGLIEAVELDVTDRDSVRAAADLVAGCVGDRGLSGLVNNAGVGMAGPLEHLDLDRIRRHFEVNVFGQLEVTQACLPLLRRGQGRIVMIGSVGGWITMPFAGPLCASKHALRAFSDALRMELHGWGLPVVLVEPGAVRSAAVDKLEADVEPTIAALGEVGAERYGDAYRRVARAALAHERSGAASEVVAATVLKALRADHPRARYPTGPASRTLGWAGRLLPDRVLDAVRLRMLGVDGR
ncbi:MAG TPA: SDR family oxidoreductase [Friedmanniella sp.]